MSKIGRWESYPFQFENFNAHSIYINNLEN